MAELTSGPATFFSEDHRACDTIWGAIEGADAARLSDLWQRFEKAMRRHFAMEEEVLFPALEDAMGMHGGGPTEVMRMEHKQMRGLLDQMRAVAEQGNHERLLDLGDTLLMLTQQHNVKEEGILYPMADQCLGEPWAELSARLKAF